MSVNLTKLSANVNNIQALSDRPNTTDGLTSAELKAKFDKAGSDIKEYLNGTLISELDLELTEIESNCSQSEMDIEDLNTSIDQLTNNIGNLSNLKTNNKENVVGAINEISENVYSTNEIKTNKIWVDGKPIYIKTFINPDIAISTSGTTLGTIQNIDTWTGSDYRISAPNSKNSGRTGYLNSSYYSGIQVSTSGAVSIYGHDGQSNVYAQVTIEYTKTTD